MKAGKLFYISFCLCAFVACRNADKTGNERRDSAGVKTNADSAEKADTLHRTVDVTYRSGVDGDGADFMKAAALGGMMEVELGKSAQQKASDARVKEFAARMIADHTKAGNELKAIAEKKEVLLPSVYPADVKAQMDAMKKLNGAEFDQQYMEMMVSDHVKTLELFRSGSSLNSEVRDFIEHTIPVLEMHHRQAVEIKKSLNQ